MTGLYKSKTLPDITLLSEKEAKRIAEESSTRVISLAKSLGQPITDSAINRYKQNWSYKLLLGSDWVLRSPILKGVSYKEIKDVGLNLVRRHPETGVYQKFNLVAEENQAKNIGPMSPYSSWLVDGPDKIAAVMSDKPIPATLKASAWEQTLDHLRNLLPPGKLSPWTIEEVLDSLDSGGGVKKSLDGTTSSGPLWYMSRWKAPVDKRIPRENMNAIEYERAIVFQQIMETTKGFLQNILSGADPKEAIPYFLSGALQRMVSKANPNKRKRGIIALWKPDTILGKMVVGPAQQALLNIRNPDGTRVFAGWWPLPTIDKNMQHFIKTAIDNKTNVLSGDISNFDASCVPDLMWQVAQAVSEWFNDEGKKIWLAVTYTEIYKTYVITPNDILLPCPSSIKSGQITTSIFGCLMNYAAQIYGHYAGYYTLIGTAIMGDDSVSVGPDPASNELAFADLGYEANADKAEWEPNIAHFLQRSHYYGLPGGVASICRTLNSVANEETESKVIQGKDKGNPYAYEMQAIMRLENAAFNPGFEALVKYVAHHDKLHLGRNIDPNQIVDKAGQAGKDMLSAADNKPWSIAGSGIPFAQFATIGVVKGGSLPPPGVGRFKAVYGKSYDSVTL